MSRNGFLATFALIEYKWLVFSVVAVTTIMATLDSSIVNIALPVIRAEFKVDITQVEWVVVSYLLTITSLLMIFGRLADLYGRKKVFMAGIVIFTLGSGLCAWSFSVYSLIFFRILQGVGAACITANGIAIITSAFPTQERGFAIGWVGTTVAVGLSAGPIVGGAITTYLGWRYIFFINLPLGIVAFFLAQKFLRESDAVKSAHFDFAGAVTLTFALVAFLLAFTEYERWGMNAFFLMILAFIALLIIFILIELKVQAPTVDLKLFSNGTFSYANLSGFLNFAGRFSVVFLFPFYLVDLRGMTPSQAGLLMTPIPLLFAVIAPITGNASDRHGTRLFTTSGMLITALGLAMLVFIQKESSIIFILISLIFMGVGGGMFSSPNSSDIMGSAPRNSLGVAGAMTALVRNLGMIVGVAWSGALFSAIRGHNPDFHHTVERIIPAFQTTMKVAVVIILFAALASFRRSSAPLRN